MAWKDWPAVERDIQNSREAAAAARADQVFMTSPSPGQIGRFLQNKSYATEEESIVKARPGALVIAGANPRHEHEWKVWKDVKLPFEYPELMAERIVRYASVVGRDHLMAGVDCGFGTFAGRVQVDTNIVWLKLRSLVEGARLASAELWA